MGQSECCQAVSPPQDKLAIQPTNLHLKLIQLQEDPVQTNIQPQHLTYRSNYSKKLGDCEEGQFISNRPHLSPDIRQRLELLQSIEQECYRRLRGQRGVMQPNKYFKFVRTGIVYEGEWLNSKPHGYGRNFYPSGGLYQGTFISGIAHGYGRFINSNGHYYQGQVKYGRGNGQGLYMTSSILFKGNFKDNALHGDGQQKGPDHYFKGQFEYGSKKHGVFKYQGNVYQGAFENDSFEGEGVLLTNEGRYVGNFHQGLQHGYGQFQWKNGSKYRGNYSRGIREGDGQFYNGQTNTICRGIWRKGMLQGDGEYQQPRGKLNQVVWKQSQILSFR